MDTDHMVKVDNPWTNKECRGTVWLMVPLLRSSIRGPTGNVEVQYGHKSVDQQGNVGSSMVNGPIIKVIIRGPTGNVEVQYG
ncbi:hypothetical protein CEXT_61241 [Caerostris extrusa]|uniref:Uncharacterized protein n=1 Tax=Caerostris extrusa TaxID=172846 RepID=A0AAV4V4J4_CAEEX|nr:hypothetical protein CEXT_61241 [Caerostris extrusa]